MAKVYRIKQGLDIKLKGKAESIIKQEHANPNEYALKPTDFAGLTPKLTVREGDTVKAGTPLFYDKYHPEVKYVSPVSGVVKEVRRGERRRILEVVVSKNEGAIEYETFDANENASIDEIKKVMLEAGIFPAIKQRPYDIVADPHTKPKAVFVSAFDTAPLAVDYDFVINRNLDAFHAGLRILSKFAPLYLNVGPTSSRKIYEGSKEAKVSIFRGPHPASNVGTQINKLNPINKDEVVWTIAPQDIIILGRLFEEKKYDARILTAVCGSEIINPLYVELPKGFAVKEVLCGNLKDDNTIRIISGNVLTGTKIEETGYLGFYSSQITVIPEGDEYEFLGWAKPGFGKMSVSRTFFSWLNMNKKYELSSNLHGEERAFVMTDEYDKVFPMDILPVQLLKAILAKDIDKMEQLGIYEVAPEDFALCEFVCTSKIESQRIVREGLNYLKTELS
ncbi:Na(+)-translocating NADH:ubiquinone oxidoreductase A subunit [Balneicella halophila]|uniref:Na(+)-translocating NADH-quinone reductase subunit A n=1 Tax=Balneicella halophila TaxID=1537566 RepID=A0A7L4UT00_BALHA|nr:Na(+)-translocating NADH-quinone reductase subunit A [Balneicella halophila]PVX52621.1 Na(+)-translocating NADH:ubiquinone oxidoreductase A subunit [Balneicella halophila]